MTDGAVALAPVSGKARIDILDILRGIAILGIFFMNVPFMGARIFDVFVDPKAIGWTPLDAASWSTVQVVLEGTQRGLLELLFGAGLMVMAKRAMTPDAPVAIADLYLRRNLWLLGFGLFDIFVLLWAGDILHVYALAALFLFPFRKLGPRLLVLLGCGFLIYTVISGSIRYAERSAQIDRVEAAQQKQAARAPLSAEEKKTLDEWNKLVERRRGQDEETKAFRKQETSAHQGGFLAYAGFNIGAYVKVVYGSLLASVAEAFCMMLIGIALWKWGVIQGERSARFYLLLALACYVPGMAARWVAIQELLLMAPIARTAWITQEGARMLVSIGHVALINLLVKAAAGRALLAPFKAAGRTAFSLYFLQQIVGLFVIFAPWFAFDLWGKLGWSGLYGVAVAVVVVELVIANLWVRWFANGPMEWAWRSLAYRKRQPFLRARAAPPEPATGP